MKLTLPKINFGSVTKRLGAGALAAATTATVQVAATGLPPHTATQIGLTALAGLIAAVPAGAAPAGLLTPAAPGQAALLPQLLAGLKALPGMPRASRNALLVATAEAAALAAVTKFAERTGQFGPGQLASASTPAPALDAATPAPTEAPPSPTE